MVKSWILLPPTSMYPYLRWFGIVLRNLVTRRPLGVLEESRLRFHVWPGDLDFFGHMNNGRYLSLMDSGRFDIISRIGLLFVWRKHGWLFVLGGASIEFHRPLRPFQRFELRSRIVGWDAKWFFIEQRFEAEGRPIASAVVKGLVRAPGRSVPTTEILALLGVSDASPPVGEAARRLGVGPADSAMEFPPERV